jgi:endonuclease YncB( thermonuclease family)
VVRLSGGEKAPGRIGRRRGVHAARVFRGRASGVKLLAISAALALVGCDTGAAIQSREVGSSAASGTFTFTCTVASITDGDTFRCAETEASGKQIRVRLSGVAAREKDGTCSTGHPCPDATAEAATATLRRLALGRELTCRQVGTTYDRRAAFCRVGRVDLSCAMVASGTVAKWPKHWGSHRC